MTKLIAHISDLHLLGRSASSRAIDPRTQIVSVMRPVDPPSRYLRVLRALTLAISARADHIVLSGDMTELGRPHQFEELAEALSDAEIDGPRVTLVPGNHDRYDEPRAFERALAGPLRPWARQASEFAGKVVDLGTICLLPLDVTIPQSVARSRGVFTSDMAEALKKRLATFRRSQRVAVVQHHPPTTRAPVVHWFHGLQGADREREILDERVQILHGHTHAATTESIDGRDNALLGASATVDDPEGIARVNLYWVTDAGLTPVYMAKPIAA
ncbi:MAG: metallophosphoesterase [Polyangiaceae bacterium]